MEFLSYLETLEAQLEPYSEGQKAQALLAGLRPELRAALTNQTTVPETRIELARVAARMEDNSKELARVATEVPQRSRRDVDGTKLVHRDRRNGNRTRREWRHNQDRLPDSEGAAPTRNPTVASPEFAKGVSCYNCGREGHYANKCPDKRKVAALSNATTPEN